MAQWGWKVLSGAVFNNPCNFYFLIEQIFPQANYIFEDPVTHVIDTSSVRIEIPNSIFNYLFSA
ncbi:MAG: hypothetical protein ACE14O_05815 [Candidatus Cloacimonadaceae bacterium]